MKKTKYLNEYRTRINGVPVTFENVPYVDAWDSKEIQINFHSKELQNKVCEYLLKNRPLLTGGVLKFIRNYLDYSLQKMNDIFFDKTKATLSEWEKNLDKPLPVSYSTMKKVYNKLFTAYQAAIIESLLENREVEEGRVLSEDIPINFNSNQFKNLDDVGS